MRLPSVRFTVRRVMVAVVAAAGNCSIALCVDVSVAALCVGLSGLTLVRTFDAIDRYEVRGTPLRPKEAARYFFVSALIAASILLTAFLAPFFLYLCSFPLFEEAGIHETLQAHVDSPVAVASVVLLCVPTALFLKRKLWEPPLATGWCEWRPRFRFRLSTMLWLVALVAIALFARRVAQDGPESHWLLLKLRYGNVESRRSAAIRAFEVERHLSFHEIFGPMLNGPVSPRTLERWRRRRQRQAEILIPALTDATRDPDLACRTNAMRALSSLASSHASESGKLRVLRLILASTRDPEEPVRAAALDCLGGLTSCDTAAVIATIRVALADPSVDIRAGAAMRLGMTALIVPASQAEVASILMPLVASREAARVRAHAVQVMGILGNDLRRYPPGGGSDVVPALLASLSDPDVEVRRAAARGFGSRTIRKVSEWEARKGAILPALNVALSDPDKLVREESALALFALGQRGAAISDLIEQAAGEAMPPGGSDFQSAWDDLRKEQEGAGLEEPPAEEVGALRECTPARAQCLFYQREFTGRREETLRIPSPVSGEVETRILRRQPKEPGTNGNK